MNVEVIPTSQATVVVPNGDLNAASGAELKRTLEDLLAKGNTRLVVDMERVAYVDSLVWGELATAATRARGAGGELRICAMGGELLEILRMIRLSALIAVFPSREFATVFSQPAG
jgi:anti-sigma B factor antagonist